MFSFAIENLCALVSFFELSASGTSVKRRSMEKRCWTRWLHLRLVLLLVEEDRLLTRLTTLVFEDPDSLLCWLGPEKGKEESLLPRLDFETHGDGRSEL